jgi:hypothetical protein
MACLRVDDRVFYANGFEKGILRSGRHEDWGGRPYPGPAFTIAYGEPPAGRLLEYYGGRIFMAVGETAFFTCAVGLFHWVDLAAGYLPPLDGDIRMLRAVDDGLYIGTPGGVVFASGARPEEFVYRRVCRTAPVEGTDALLPEGGSGKAVGKEYRGKAAVVFLDVREDDAPAKRFGIRAIPTQIFFDKTGKEVTRHEGFMEKKAIADQLNKLLAK